MGRNALKYYYPHLQREHRSRKRKHDPEGYMLLRIRNRAKARGLEFNLERGDLPVPTVCPILGEPLYFSDDGRHDHTPSVDRLDNSKGYVKGNVRVISWRANKMKADMTIFQVQRLLEYMTCETH